MNCRDTFNLCQFFDSVCGTLYKWLYWWSWGCRVGLEQGRHRIGFRGHGCQKKCLPKRSIRYHVNSCSEVKQIFSFSENDYAEQLSVGWVWCTYQKGQTLALIIIWLKNLKNITIARCKQFRKESLVVLMPSELHYHYLCSNNIYILCCF